VVEVAACYWSANRHPIIWSHRRRYHPRRQSGVAWVPALA
jgi:hypothetical protein